LLFAYYFVPLQSNLQQNKGIMNKIVRKEQFSEKVFLFEIEAPLIAKSRKAGNFVIVRVDQRGERMPLTIAGADIDKGTITLVVQMVGLSSK
jgi:glutamate synthase (NADPH/NADH) small chain